MERDGKSKVVRERYYFIGYMQRQESPYSAASFYDDTDWAGSFRQVDARDMCAIAKTLLPLYGPKITSTFKLLFRIRVFSGKPALSVSQPNSIQKPSMQ